MGLILRREVDPKFEEIVKAWNDLGNDEQEKLIPILLDNIVGWHAFDVTDFTRLHWLKHTFERAGVPFHKQR